MRLIDADALMKEALADGAYGYVSAEQIANAPTIDLSEQAKHDIVTIIENEMDMRVLADRKHGKWEKISDRNYKCSCCDAWWSVDRDSVIKDFKFCPNCGADMRGEYETN